ncbi:MAG: M20/M25/M40 family metallo-hydrolase [Acidobacteria bacterium]|nr:M20/M25/M40 family metallo-hydrolase [Acidobacteriota bacterium]
MALLLSALLAAAACGGGSTARDTGDDVLDAEAVEETLGDEGTDADADADDDADGGADADADAGDAEAEAEVYCGPDPDRIYDDVRELASAAYEGRLPDSPGGERALDWAEARLESLGLDPSGDGGGFRQGFAYDQWGLTAPPALDLGDGPLALATDFAVFQYSGAGDVTEEIVFAGYGMTVPPFDPATYPRCPFPAAGYDDFAGIDVTGKIVLLLRHGPGDDSTVPDECPASAACGAAPCLWNFGYKAANARLHGAAAMLLVQHYAEAPAVPEGVTLDESYYDAGFPALVVDRTVMEAAVPDLPTWVGNIDAAMQPDTHATGVTATVSVGAEIRSASTANLVAVVPGTDPTLSSETVVIGSHIDHLGIDPLLGEIMPGADDNASGTATTLELARSVVECGVAPARTLVFMLFNAEEAGLIGSCYYVENPAYPIGDVAAMFSLDMVGAGDGTGLILYGATESRLRWLADLMEGASAEAGLTYEVQRADPWDVSDHACFYYAGAPAVFAFTAGAHDGYHTPEDGIGHIRVDDLQVAAELMWATLLPLAMGTEDGYTAKSAPLFADPAAPRPDLDRERRVIR